MEYGNSLKILKFLLQQIQKYINKKDSKNCKNYVSVD